MTYARAVALVVALHASSVLACDEQKHLKDLAKDIAKATRKAARKFGCPVAVSAACSPDGCSLKTDDAAVVTASCNLTKLTSSISYQMSHARSKAKVHFGCDDLLKVRCAAGDAPGMEPGSFWSCAYARLQVKGGGPAPPQHQPGQCSESLLLADMAEEVHDELSKRCPTVASVVCPAVGDAGACRFGRAASSDGAKACPLVAKDRLKREVTESLKKAGKRYGCPTGKVSLCERDEAQWWSCTFVAGTAASASLPEGHTEL